MKIDSKNFWRIAIEALERSLEKDEPYRGKFREAVESICSDSERGRKDLEIKLKTAASDAILSRTKQIFRWLGYEFSLEVKKIKETR